MMIKSMTGFGRSRAIISPWGRVNLEIRSVNHRFLGIVVHLPEGFFYLEQRLKNEINKVIKRGHIICRLEVSPLPHKEVVLNKGLIKEYYLCLRQISKQLNIKQDININTLVGLPGVWSTQSRPYLALSWEKIKPLVKEALDSIIRGRQKEGRAISQDLGKRAKRSGQLLKTIKTRFKRIIKQRLKLCSTEEEKNSFLKSSDISEEVVRLNFHLKNFTHCLKNTRAVGKELDFILQEMQREANTMGAKSIDVVVSDRVIGMKSEIERMREQVQNVE